MQRSLWIVCAVIATVAACKKPVKQNLKPDDIRADVLAKVTPFLDYPPYAVTDPDIVDPCLAKATAQPTNRTSAISEASMCIQSALGTPDGFRRIEKKIADHYANPTITRAGDTVTIAVGAPAGTIAMAINRPTVSSPYIVEGEWTTSEVVRVLKLAMDRYPDARLYEATVLIPKRSGDPDWKYVYDRGEDRLMVITPSPSSTTYVSGTIGGDITKLRSAQRRDLTVATR